MAFLVPKLVGLRSEFDSIAPNRDKASDGWIGDAAHRQSRSGHNPDESGNAEFDDTDSADEVRAIDIDADLRIPDGPTMETCANYIRGLCRNGTLNWIHYIIYNRRIASSIDNWAWRPYTGSNPHDKHLHVSANLRGDTSGYVPIGLANLLAGVDMDLTPENLRQIGQACWAFRPADHENKTAHAIVLNDHTDLLEEAVISLGNIASTLSLSTARIEEILREISDDPEVSVTLGEEQIGALAESVSTRVAQEATFRLVRQTATGDVASSETP